MSEEHLLKRNMGGFGLLFISIGAMIGSGWLFSALYAAQLAGPAAIISWIISALIGGVIALVFAELASRMPLTGYSYQWVTRLAGPAWGWLTGWIAVCFLVIVVPLVDHVIAGVIGHVAGIPADSGWLTAITGPSATTFN